MLNSGSAVRFAVYWRIDLVLWLGMSGELAAAAAAFSADKT